MSEDIYEAALLWPRYIEKKWASRLLAAYALPGTLVSEDGQKHPCDGFTDFIITLFDKNMLTFVDDLATFPYLQECLARGAYIPCTEMGKPIAIRMKGPRNTTRWIVNASAWDGDLSQRKDETREEHMARVVAWMQLIREVMGYVGVGTQTTPGATGQALMRRAWKEAYGEEGWRGHRHQRPPKIACHQIETTTSGARSDTIEMGTSFELAWEVDRKNAYGKCLEQLPSGPTYRIFKGRTDGWASYYVRCRVTITEQLVLGPFPVRVRDETRGGKGSKPVFPTAPGEYITWLWKEEIEKARAEGCLVETFEGWGWQEFTNDFQPFVNFMTRLRDEAPPHIAPYIKKFLVAAIGRFGMPSGLYIMVPEDQAGPDDVAICDKAGIMLDWFAHWIPDKHPMTMPHWFSFILMQCRLALYEMALPYAESEQLIATNTDAVIVKAEADVSSWPDRDQPIATGQWRKRLLHEVVVPAARHLESVEKWVTPGVPESKRVRKYNKRE